MTMDGDYGGRAAMLPPADANMIPDSNYEPAVLLQRILRALEPPDELYDLPIFGASHVKIKSKYLVLTPTAAMVVTLQVGTVSRLFAIATIETKIFPFPYVIPRGIDVKITPSVGAVSGYMVAMPQNESDEDARWR